MFTSHKIFMTWLNKKGGLGCKRAIPSAFKCTLPNKSCFFRSIKSHPLYTGNFAPAKIW